MHTYGLGYEATAEFAQGLLPLRVLPRSGFEDPRLSHQETEHDSHA